MKNRTSILTLLVTSAAIAPTSLCFAGLEPEWVSTFATPGSVLDQFADLALDAQGNIFVAGTVGTGSPANIVTVSFDAQGTERWVSTFNGPADGQDVAQAIATGADESVYVVGRGPTVSSSSDYILIKYDASTGAEVWARFHDGPSGSIDEARDVAVDAQGNIFVTGGAWAGSEGSDIETLKYDAEGTLLWSARYTGPGFLPFANDRGDFIAIDPTGDVLVTGASAAFSGIDDFVILKYDGDTGAEEWTSRYDGIGLTEFPRAMALTSDGDPVITGISYQPLEMFATVRYRNADGEQIWANVDNPGVHDSVTGLVLSESAAFISAVSDPDGDESNNNNDLYAARYDLATGATVWNAYHGEQGFGDFDGGYSITRDGLGNLYVGGRTNSFGADSDLLLLRFDEANGDELERSTYSGVGGFDTALRAALAPSGGIVLAGVTSGPTFSTDYLVLTFPGQIAADSADLDEDGTVGFSDLLILLAAWGSCGNAACPADLDADSLVGFNDLLTLLASWG